MTNKKSEEFKFKNPKSALWLSEPKMQERAVLIIGEKNSGKTTSIVLCLDDIYINKAEFANTLGLCEGILRNIDYGLDPEGHDGKYLDTGFAEGKYKINANRFFKTINEKKPDDVDVLDLDITEIGGHLLERMKKFHTGEKFREESINNKEAKEFVKDIKQACELPINKIKSFDENDCILYYINMGELFNTNNKEIETRMEKIIENVAFIKSLNSKLKIKFILNRLDDINSGTKISFVEAVYAIIAYKVAETVKEEDRKQILDRIRMVFFEKIFYTDPQPKSLLDIETMGLRESLDKTISNTFYNVFREHGIQNIEPTDFIPVYILEDQRIINIEDSIKVWKQIWDTSDIIEDSSFKIISGALKVFHEKIKNQDNPLTVNPHEVEIILRESILNAVLAHSSTKNLRSGAFEKALNKLYNVGITKRLHENGVDDAAIKLKLAKSVIHLRPLLSPVVPSTFELRDFKGIQEFIDFLVKNEIPVPILISEESIIVPSNLITKLLHGTLEAGVACVEGFNTIIEEYNNSKNKEIDPKVETIIKSIQTYVNMIELLQKLGRTIPDLEKELIDPIDLPNFKKILSKVLKNFKIHLEVLE